MDTSPRSIYGCSHTGPCGCGSNPPKEDYDYPMGVSQWKEYGKKYHYWQFFTKRILMQAKKYKTMPRNFINFIEQL